VQDVWLSFDEKINQVNEGQEAGQIQVQEITGTTPRFGTEAGRLLQTNGRPHLV
jgi:hypothetical protein